MSKLDSSKGLYQVWITSYPLDGASESSKYDPGFQLVGQFDNIREAVALHNAKEAYSPLITKFVTWHTEITDVSEATHKD